MYSNVIPPTLPTWDSVAYPYYVLVFLYEKCQVDWYQVKLYYSETPFTYNGTGVTTEGIVCLRTRKAIDSEWLDEFIPLDILNLQHGLSDTGLVFTRIWTNHNILDSSGDVWLAAGSITEAAETATPQWLYSFKMGLALGLAGKPLPIVKPEKEPAAYLYPGI